MNKSMDNKAKSAGYLYWVKLSGVTGFYVKAAMEIPYLMRSIYKRSTLDEVRQLVD